MLTIIARALARKAISIAAVAVVAGALAAPVSAAEQQGVGDWQKVIADAKKEGKLVVYGNAGGGITDDMLRRFEKTYGIEVEFVRNATPAALRERARTEQAAGLFTGDVVMSAATIRTMIPLGHVQKHLPVPNDAKMLPPAVDDGYFLDYALMPHGVAYNTEMLKPGQEPQSWQDLLDPKWKGKMIAFEPRTNGPGLAIWGVLLDVYGKDYIRKLAAQNIVFTNDLNLSTRRVAQGEFPLYIGQVMTSLYQVKGLPVGGLPMKEGLPWAGASIGILTNAPHPNAARLALNWMLEDEMQRFLVEQGQWNVTGVKSERIPDNMRNLQHIKWLGTFGAERINPLIEELKVLMK